MKRIWVNIMKKQNS